MIGDDHSTAFTVYIFYMHVLQSEIHWQVMSAMARQKSHQWTVPGFPEHVSTQEGTKNIGSNVFVKARESRYIKVTVWKYKVSFQLSMNDESSHQTWIFFCLASRPERTGTCGQTCPNDIKSLKKCLKHVKFLGDHDEISRGQLVSNIKPSTNLMPATRAKGVSCSFGLSSGVIHKFL